MEVQVRLDAFEELLRLSKGRVDEDALGEAHELLERVGGRRRLSLDHTVVALAGPTGGGKSSLFNAVCGLDLSPVGVRRPTTSVPKACAWDPQGAEPLLARLGVAGRLRFPRRVVLDNAVPAAEQARRGGLVLLDLPDHDSVDARHRAEAERLLGLVDVVVWVLDPEKYGDTTVHERFLRPMAGHADVMLVVLNQIDRLPGDAASQCAADLRRLLDENGLAVGEHGDAGTQVLATSALTGEGVDELREELARVVVGEQSAAGRRAAADLDVAAARLRPLIVGRAAAGMSEGARERFLERLGDSVGARAAGEAAARGFHRRAAVACATPYGRLIGRRRARVPSSGRRAGGRIHRPFGSLGVGLAAQRAVVDEAVRAFAGETAAGLPDPWARGVRKVALKGAAGLAGELDRAVAKADVRGAPRQWWWAPVALTQWLFMAAALVGAVGLVARGAGALMWPWWLPAALFAGGVLAGVGLAQGCSAAARGSACRYGEDVERELREAAGERGSARVLEPVAAELRRYRQVRERYVVATGSGFRPDSTTSLARTGDRVIHNR